MSEDKEKKQETNETKDKLFDDLLDEFEDDLDDDEEQEEEQEEKDKDADEKDRKKKEEEERSQKNKDAEEARKRREAEAKKQKAEKKAEDRTNALGKQLVDFKRRYPDVDLSVLDSNKSFKKYLDGKLLGKKSFIELYEDYLDISKEISGKTEEEISKGFRKKAEASSGSSVGTGHKENPDVFSEDELEKVAEKLPFMSDKEASKILEKFEKSVDYYKKT